MKFVKSALRNKMGDDYMSHSLICFVETKLLVQIPNEVIVQRFHGASASWGLSPTGHCGSESSV
jgi:hypothetical protein